MSRTTILHTTDSSGGKLRRGDPPHRAIVWTITDVPDDTDDLLVLRIAQQVVILRPSRTCRFDELKAGAIIR